MFEIYKKTKSLKKYQKLNSEETFLKEDDKAVIEIKTNDQSQLFSSFGDGLSNELCSYIEEKADAIPFEYDIKIKLSTNYEQLKRVESCLKTKYEQDIHSINRQMKYNNFFSFVMFLSGIFAFFIFALFTKLNFHFMFCTFAEIATWVFFWEAVDSFFLETRHLKFLKLRKYRILCSTISSKENYFESEPNK